MKNIAYVNHNINSLQNYVTVDEACVSVFPLLIGQLEIVNTQLEEGVGSLVGGFTALAKSMELVNTLLNEHHLDEARDYPAETVAADHSFGRKVERIKRFSDDLIQMGESIHETAARETVQNLFEKDGLTQTQNVNRIILRTLSMQQLAADIKRQAGDIMADIKSMSGAIAQSEHPARNQLQDIFTEMQIEVNKMVIAFQFQDRVGQIIRAVINAMQDLSDYIREAATQARLDETDVFVNLNEILHRVEKYYISQEQYAISDHGSGSASDDIILF